MTAQTRVGSQPFRYSKVMRFQKPTPYLVQRLISVPLDARRPALASLSETSTVTTVVTVRVLSGLCGASGIMRRPLPLCGIMASVPAAIRHLTSTVWRNNAITHHTASVTVKAVCA